jgi:hypothetical protein
MTERLRGRANQINVKEQRPIDLHRMAGGSLVVGTPSEGAITSMAEIDGALYVIKERAIYALRAADQMDPGRTNSDLPRFVHQRICSVGSQSEVVGRTLLTAVNLFQKGKFLPSWFAHERALVLTLDALENMVGMRAASDEFEVAQKEANDAAQSSARNRSSMQIPQMGDIKTRLRTFAQRGDHAANSLFGIVELFYTDFGSGGWEKMADLVATRYGADDLFTKFLGEAIPFLQLVRNVRDCLEHNLKGASVKDFVLLPAGQIVAPTIGINFRHSRQPPISISLFMGEIMNMMTAVFEIMIAHLCDKHAQSPTPDLPIVVGALQENRRREKFVRFSYGTYLGEDFVPTG